MKVFTRRERRDWRPLHPEDLTCIITYLKERGELHVSNEAIERFYCNFSKEEYNTDWVIVRCDCYTMFCVLENFVRYMEDLDI